MWIVTNLAYGDEDDLAKIFDPQIDLLSQVQRLLQGEDTQMLEQCFWFLANVCGESERFRDYILDRIDVYAPMKRLV